MTQVISLQERRKHPRVSDAIALHIDAGGTLQKASADNPVDDAINPVPTHIVQMSCSGMRFLHDTSLDTDTNLVLRMHLASSDTTLHINSRVVASGEEKSAVRQSYYVQVAFQDIDSNIQQLLENHINYVIEKTGVRNRTAGYSG